MTSAPDAATHKLDGMQLPRPPAGGVVVVPMSRMEFDALPEMPHAEWWDGACVVTGTTRRHARAVVRLGAMIADATSAHTLEVGSGAGWRLPDAEFAPDLFVARPGPPDELLTQPPVLAVEVLSPSTRHIDLGRKRELYASGGLEWYWVVDLGRNELTILRNVGGASADGLVEIQRFGTGTTVGPVEITVDVAAL